ncbi:hypothetical protein T07_4295 [Trichinella nelsoni]|uniref:Uncharacterized protein n=1 Tax=Trichinella nelsoni TaxID=6336 RepID=A0A0V0S4D3_9BILA|nr:hypothetical protein T07_4295 [Trichinella nelsoni]
MLQASSENIHLINADCEPLPLTATTKLNKALKLYKCPFKPLTHDATLKWGRWRAGKNIRKVSEQANQQEANG